MLVELFHGPINSGKTTRLLGAFAETLARGAGMFVVPAESVAVEIRRRLIETAAASAIIGDAVIAMPRFVEKLARAHRAVIGATETALLVHSLLHSRRLKYFRAQKASIGIARQFTAAILALKKNGVGPARLREILSTRGSLKENDLLCVFEDYENEKEKLGIFDDGDLTNLAIKNLRAGRADMLSKIELICFDEFFGFAPGEISLIAALKKTKPRARILISHAAPATGEELFASYLKRGIAAVKKIADKSVDCGEGKNPNAEVDVVSAISPLEEARMALDAISNAIEKTSATAEDIAVALKPRGSFPDWLIEEAKTAGFVEDHVNLTRAALAPAIQKLMSPAVVDIWPEEASASEYAKLAAEFLRRKKIPDDWIDELAKSPADRIDIARSLAAAATIESLVEKFATADSYLKLKPLRRESFARLMRDTILNESVSYGHLNHSLPFRIVPFESGIVFPAKLTIIPQMVEGSIPRIESERMFFSEADRFSPEPDPVIDEIFPTQEDSLAAESFAFETFVRKCTGKLLLTHSIISGGGTETSPSSFLTAYPEARIATAPVPVPRAARSPEFCERAKELAEIEEERLSGEAVHKSYHGILCADMPREIVSKRYTKKTLSPTGLERYAKCPFLFFAEKVLGLKPREEETPEIQPKDRGTIVHAILETFYATAAEEFKAAVGDGKKEKQLEATLDKIIERVFRDHKEIVSHMAAGLRPFQRSAIRMMALQVIRLELSETRRLKKSLIPKIHEWEFGGELKNTLVIPVENEPDALISGRVDRIDTDADGKNFLVVDYKTGKVDSVKGDIAKGLHLQLPLYVEAVRLFLLPDAKPLGGLLIAVLQAEKKHGFVRKEFNSIHYDVGRAHSAMNDEAWDEAIKSAMKAAARHTSNIRHGNFPAKPEDKCMRHCEYEEVCRYFGKGAH